jgi:type 1 fimbriae regulatory protein FimB
MKQHQRIKFFTRSELERILTAAKTSSARDYAMVLLAYRHGLRASEVCRIEISHIELDAGNIYCIRGKGSISNWQALAKDEIKAIKSYMRKRPKTDSPHLFISRNGGPLSRTQFYRVFRQLCEKVGIPEDKRHPHCLKHSLGSHLANAGVPVQVIQMRMGHRNIQNTMIYVQMSSAYVDRAFEAALANGAVV